MTLVGVVSFAHAAAYSVDLGQKCRRMTAWLMDKVMLRHETRVRLVEAVEEMAAARRRFLPPSCTTQPCQRPRPARWQQKAG